MRVETHRLRVDGDGRPEVEPVGQVVLVQTDHDRDASGPAADEEHVGQGEGRPAAGRGGAERPAANGSLIRGRAAIAGGFGV
ncbi:hypothetical protein GCM10009416_10500 [Craurococcus roseus]|uniref:Uncharacterized protein n=1 Tax=Craurococcus roseus TaxID=77585 RepID=A0ABP3PVU6_9PROT